MIELDADRKELRRKYQAKERASTSLSSQQDQSGQHAAPSVLQKSTDGDDAAGGASAPQVGHKKPTRGITNMGLLRPKERASSMPSGTQSSPAKSSGVQGSAAPKPVPPVLRPEFRTQASSSQGSNFDTSRVVKRTGG